VDGYTLDIGTPGTPRNVTAGQVSIAQAVNVSGDVSATGNVDIVDGATTIGGGVSGVDLSIAGGSVSVGGSVSGANLDVSGAAVDVAGPVTITDTIQVRGGGSLTPAVGASTNNLDVASTSVFDATVPVTVTGNAQLGTRLQISAGAGDSFVLEGANLSSSVAPRTLTVDGGTVTVVDSGGDIPSGLLYHLDAAEGVTKDGSNRVSGWADQGSAANDFVQATAAKQPLWIADGINGLPAIQFSGANNNEELLLNTETDPRSFFAVTTALTGGGLRGIWGEQGADAGIRLNDANWYRSAGHGSDGNDFANGDANGVSVNGTLLGQYVVGTPHIIAEVKGPNHTKTPYTVTSIGEYFDNNRDYHGNVAEMLVFDRILTAQEANNVGGYLAAKYGIDVVGTSYEGQSIGTGSPNLPNTNVIVNSDTTLGLTAEAGSTVVVGGVTIADSTKLTIDSDSTDLRLTNLALGTDSMLVSTKAVGVAADEVTITVGGTLQGGNGVALVGDYEEDDVGTDLTLADGSTLEWTLGPDPDNYINVDGGIVTIDGALTIKLLDGGGSLAGENVALFSTFFGASFDPTQITIEAPAGWSWDTLVGGEPDIQYIDDEFIVLKNLSTGIVVVPGDTNGDQIVDDADLAIFKAQFGGDWNGVALEDPDYDNDGDVDIDDFVVLRANFGTGVVPAPLAPDFSATPEPATMSLLAIGGLLVVRRRRRKA
jgi:hypothetical protein